MPEVYFGGKWDAPAFDEAEQIPAPVGDDCLLCHEPIAEHDSGTMMSTITMGDDGEAVGAVCPIHIECFLRQVLGSVCHLQGRCTCAGMDEEPTGTWREQGLDVMKWVRQYKESHADHHDQGGERSDRSHPCAPDDAKPS